MASMGEVITRAALSACMAASLAASIGCALPARAPVVDGPALAQTLQTRLGISLHEVPAPSTAANLHDVRAVYFGRSVNERLSAVVFDSAAATVQILGARGAHRLPAPGRLLTHNNVVVIYQHDAGTLSRLKLVQAALAATPEA